MVDQYLFDPASVEGQYGLQMASYLVHAFQPRSIMLYTQDAEIAKAASLRLAWLKVGLTADSDEVRDELKNSLGIDLVNGMDSEPDVALVLFSRRLYPEPPRAHHMVMIGQNSLSYKSLLYPGQIRDHVLAQIRWLKEGYTITNKIGMFGPNFILHWVLATAFGPRLAPAHFQIGQQAFDRIYTKTWAWWTGYITILAGDRCE